MISTQIWRPKQGLALLLFGSLLCAIGCLHRTPASRVHKDESGVTTVSEQIRECPPWARITPGDIATQRRLIKCMEELSAENTSTLRQAIEKIIEEGPAENNDPFDEWSRLYVLNRFLFNVPRKSKLADAKFFGGWHGVPQDGIYIDLLWPLRIDSSGLIELVGTTKMYTGPPYQPLLEFDYFNHRFGRRKAK